MTDQCSLPLESPVSHPNHEASLASDVRHGGSSQQFKNNSFFTSQFGRIKAEFF